MCYKRNRAHSCGTWISHPSFLCNQVLLFRSAAIFEITREIFSFFRHPDRQDLRTVLIGLFSDINVLMQNYDFVIMLNML
jgi:hypothetical protein